MLIQTSRYSEPFPPISLPCEKLLSPYGQKSLSKQAMAPARTEPDVEFESEFGVSDIEALPQRYGWPTENARGYKIREQLCGTERPLRIVHLGAGASGICLPKFLPETLKDVEIATTPRVLRFH